MPTHMPTQICPLSHTCTQACTQRVTLNRNCAECMSKMAGVLSKASGGRLKLARADCHEEIWRALETNICITDLDLTGMLL